MPLLRRLNKLKLAVPYNNILTEAGSPAGRVHSAETLIKISNVMSGENHFNYGKLLSEETKVKMSIAYTGEKSSVSKKVFVYCNSTPIILSHEFVSYSEAAKHFSCSIMTISRLLGGISFCLTGSSPKG
jgi:hypothetical protein